MLTLEIKIIPFLNQHSLLDGDGLVKTILASKALPPPLTVEHMLRLFSYPPGYKILGTKEEQIRQVGNSNAVRCAAAVFQQFYQVLLYKYKAEEE